MVTIFFCTQHSNFIFHDDNVKFMFLQGQTNILRPLSNLHIQRSHLLLKRIKKKKSSVTLMRLSLTIHHNGRKFYYQPATTFKFYFLCFIV